MSATATLHERRKALFAQATSATLATSLATLDKLVKDGGPDAQEHILARAWTIDELERRFPAASQAIEDAYLAAELRLEATGEDVEVDQVAILLAHVRAA